VITSDLKAQEVLSEIALIEKQFGRQREEKWGSRTIDIDILFYDDKFINEENLTIPHPHLHERRFTLEPLMELDPELKHPVLNKTINELYDSLSDNLKVKRLNK
jgi:2-amino-4-hydroxy-6-hydroxymethyldihydropteridine diphosphokinase